MIQDEIDHAVFDILFPDAFLLTAFVLPAGGTVIIILFGSILGSAGIAVHGFSAIAAKQLTGQKEIKDAALRVV